jgi:hypothetical protein
MTVKEQKRPWYGQYTVNGPFEALARVREIIRKGQTDSGQHAIACFASAALPCLLLHVSKARRLAALPLRL